jgi:TetR/AcrR family transcriptional regulator, regulator of mycofactocin system
MSTANTIAGVTETLASPSLRVRKKHATRHAIEDAAWALFEQKGYSQTTVSEIAERADVAPRTFFRYFPSKEAVLFPEMDRTLAELRTAFLARPVDEPILLSLSEAMNAVNAEITEDRRRQQERFALLKNAGLDTSPEFFASRLAAEVAAMVRERGPGDDPDLELKAKLVAGTITLVARTAHEHWLSTGAEGDMRDVARRCLGVLHSLLAPC